MKTYGVIMAGGGGTRFWPLSKKELPKQFLNLSGKDIMVNETFDRLTGLIDPENIFIVTNELHADYTEKVMNHRMKRDHILGEPAARNTAACIGYSAMEIVTKYGDGVMCVLASDHFIKNGEAYQNVMKEAIQTAMDTDGLVTIGIKPEFPSTGYGYIKHQGLEEKNYRKVLEFVEKPDVETAAEYLKTGNYAWNSGMFVWKASTILKYFQKLLPDIYECLLEIAKGMNTPEENSIIQRIYPTIPKISIDYGIMERADHVFMLEGDFGWNDIGSFDTLEVIGQKDSQGNVSIGEHVLLDSTGCICYSNNKLIATIGVSDLVIVEGKDVILVCPKECAQNVKKIVEHLEQEGKKEYL